DRLDIRALGDVVLDTAVNALSVLLRAAGSLTVTELDDLTDITLDLTDGFVDITAGGDLVVGDFTAAVFDADNDLTLISLGGDITTGVINLGTLADAVLRAELGSIATGIITANNLEAVSLSGLDLQTDINSLTADVLGTGNLRVVEAGALRVDLARTANGDITIITGGDLELVNLDSSNDVTLSIQGALNQGSGRLVANLLTLDAIGDTRILTQVQAADISISGTGVLEIDELDGITLHDLDTADGSITVNAAGAVVVRDVRSLNTAAAHDIVITTTTGDITVTEALDAGSLGDVTLSTDAGAVEVDAALRVLADSLTVRATTGIDLRTQVARLDALNTGTGEIIVVEFDGLQLDRAATTDGSVNITAGGNTTVEVLTAGNNGSATFSITGSLRQQFDPTTLDKLGKVTARDLSAEATGAIDLLTAVEAAVLRSTTAGDIRIVEDDALELTLVSTANGSVTVSAGGTIRALDVRSLTGLDNNDISLTALTGDIEYGDIIAAGDADIILNAPMGSVLPIASLLAGDEIIVTAAGSIHLITDARSITARSTVAGDLLIVDSGAVELKDLFTQSGSINVDAGGLIEAVSVVSQTSVAGHFIRLANTFGNLLLGTVNAGSGADVTLVTTGSVGMRSKGLVTARDLTVTAGAAINLATDIDRITASTTGAGLVSISEKNNLTALSVVSHLGDVLIATGGDLVLETVTAGGTNSLAQLTAGGSITQSTGKVTAHSLTAEAKGSLTLRTQVADASVKSTVAGNVTLTEDDGLNLVLATAKNGVISVTAGGALKASDVRILDNNASNAITLRALGGNLETGIVNAGGLGTLLLDAFGAIIDLGGLLTADTLTALAAQGIQLTTTVNTLTARNSGHGNIIIKETNALDILEAITHGFGSIVINTGGNLSLTDIRAGSDDAGTSAVEGAVTLNVLGSILQNTGQVAGTLLTADARGQIRLFTAVNEIIARTAGSNAGGIEITEDDAVILSDISAAQGAVRVTSGGAMRADRVVTSGQIEGTNITLQTLSGGLELTFVSAGTLGDVNITSAGEIDGTVGSNGLVSGRHLTTNSELFTDLRTSVGTLIAEVLGDGYLRVTEDNALEVRTAHTVNGLIDIATGGLLTALDIQSMNSAPGNTITLATTSGNIAAGIINAGAFADAFLTAAGSITDLPGKITADHLTATAQKNLTLDTTVAVLTAASLDKGFILVTETDDLELLDVRTRDGAVEVSAHGTLSATRVVSETDHDANDITLRGTFGDILVGLVNAGKHFGDVTLESAGAVEIQPAADGLTPHIIADEINITAVDGIGANGDFSTDTLILHTCGNLLRALITGDGDLRFREHDDIIVESADIANGQVEIQSAGDLTILSMWARMEGTLPPTLGLILNMFADPQRDGVTVALQTTSGSIILGELVADGPEAIVNLDAADSILTLLDIDPQTTQLKAKTANLRAVEDIGELPDVLAIEVDDLTIETDNGGTRIENRNGAQTKVHQVNVAGLFGFKQIGGDLDIDELTSGSAHIWLQGRESIFTMLRSAVGGELFLKAQEMEFDGGPVSIGYGNLVIEPDIDGTLIQLFAARPNNNPNILELSAEDIAAIGWPNPNIRFNGIVVFPNEFPGLPEVGGNNVTPFNRAVVSFDLANLDLQLTFLGRFGNIKFTFDLESISDSGQGRRILENIRLALAQLGSSEGFVLAPGIEEVEEAEEEPAISADVKARGWLQIIMILLDMIVQRLKQLAGVR
ncbi:MAG: beta strand repeat-containing protein, partial [Candidatus Methylacidiphilales bacterium]